MEPKFNFLSMADFLSGAIKDAGPSAELRKETAAPATAEQAATHAENTTVSEPTKAKKSKKKKSKKKAQTQTLPEIPVQATHGPEPFARKLVTVKKVDGVENFDSKNNLIHIEGWTVRAPKAKGLKKDQFVIFLEVDTFLPASGSPLFAEAASKKITFEGEEGYLVTTSHCVNPVTKARIISQGHIFAPVDFPPIWADFGMRKADFKGTPEEFTKHIREIDFTALLGPGVRKWTTETQLGSGAQVLNRYPTFIKKTDIERVQNCPNLFVKDKYKVQIFQETTKMDGCSMTVYFVHRNSRYYNMLPPLSPLGTQYTQHANGRLGVCSKNHDLPFDPENLYWRAAIQANYHIKLPQLGQTIAIQGELVGDGIHDNWYDYPAGENDFLTYSIFEIHGSKRWDPRTVEEFAAEHRLRHVPVIGYSTVWNIARSHENLLLRADLQIGDEGLVFKNCTDGRWFKVLSRNFEPYKERHEATCARDEAAGVIVDEVEVMGYDPDAAEDWLTKWENGELDEDESVQAFLDRWEEEWYGTTAGDRAAVDEKKQAKPTENKCMNDVWAWLAEGQGEATDMQ